MSEKVCRAYSKMGGEGSLDQTDNSIRPSGCYHKITTSENDVWFNIDSSHVNCSNIRHCVCKGKSKFCTLFCSLEKVILLLLFQKNNVFGPNLVKIWTFRCPKTGFEKLTDFIW